MRHRPALCSPGEEATASCRVSRAPPGETASRVPGRTGCCVLPLLSGVTNCPAASTGSPASWENHQSLKTGVVVCPANEKPEIPIFWGNIQSCILSQNKRVAQKSFKSVSFENIQEDLLCGELLFFGQRSKCPSAGDTEHQFLAERETWPSGGQLFLTQASLDFKSELNENLFPLQAAVFSSTCFP